MLLCPAMAAVLATVATMPSAVMEAWSLTLCGASEPQTVTVLSWSVNPRSTASDGHGDSASFSATQ
jgi:hypothetical protein